MSSTGYQRMARNIAVAGAVLVGTSTVFANDNGTPMTAGVVVDEMPIRERTSYVMGIVEGLAYARFVQDTKEKGEQDQSGMNCIYRWLHSDMVGRMGHIDTAFRKYSEHLPSVVIAAMAKKECGE